MTTITTAHYTWTEDEMRLFPSRRYVAPFTAVVVTGVILLPLLIAGIAYWFADRENHLFVFRLLCFWPLVLAYLAYFGSWAFTVWQTYQSPPNESWRQQLLTVERWNEFTSDFYTTYLADGSFVREQWPIQRIQVFKTAAFYLTYAAYFSLGIPLRAFESDEDRQRFESLLVDKGIKIVHKK